MDIKLLTELLVVGKYNNIGNQGQRLYVAQIKRKNKETTKNWGITK